MKIGAPLGGILVVIEVTPTGDGGTHTGVASGLDVAHMIPHIEAVAGRDAKLLAGKEHGGGVGLAHRQSVGADGDAATGKRRQRSQQRLGEKARLVGDDAPGQLFLVEPLDKIHHAFIGAGADTEVGRVVVEQGGAKAGGAQLLQQLVTKTGPEQPEGPVRGSLTDDVVRKRRKAFAYQHMVDGSAEIRRGVEQGTVQIKQHAAKGCSRVSRHQPCSGRSNATM